MGITEDIRADLRDAVRDVKARDLRVCLKSVTAQHRQLAMFADRDIGQLGAEVERVVIDPRHTVGDHNLGQAAVAKSTPADPLQLRAFFKAHALQLAAPEEVELADVGDILADDHMLDLPVVLTDRSHATGFVIIHSAGSVHDHCSVAVENIDRRLTTQSSI